MRRYFNFGQDAFACGPGKNSVSFFAMLILTMNLDNIETNIISAADNVKAAKEEVQKAEESQISSRKKLIFFALFIFIMVVVIALVVVFALKNKSD